ncbi:NUDIX hydrolase [Dactylosporangium sp. CA-139114]|uniref:NUDIX hydrolase n=1 Tax=Dactylosporangium sp. CA-139114 TaxID=3239931 RepID=UPI003D977AB8
MAVLHELIAAYRPADADEERDVARVRALLGGGGDVWSRATPLHVTASALIVDPASGRVLLRWHARQEAWLQVGGHGDPGETDPVAVALREGEEETGLADLVPYPDPARAEIVHVVVVPVNAKGDEPAHEHADVRFVLATGRPEAARPEKPDAPLRWVTVAEALGLATEPNLRETIARAGRLLTSAA